MSRILRSSRLKSSTLLVSGLKTPSLVSPLNRPHLIRKSHAYSRPSHCVLHIHLGQMMKVCRRQRSNLTAIMLLSQTKRLVSLRPTLKSLTRRDHEMLGIGMALLHRLLVRRLLNMAPMSRRRRSFKLRLMPCERNLRRKMASEDDDIQHGAAPNDPVQDSVPQDSAPQDQPQPQPQP